MYDNKTVVLVNIFFRVMKVPFKKMYSYIDKCLKCSTKFAEPTLTTVMYAPVNNYKSIPPTNFAAL